LNTNSRFNYGAVVELSDRLAATLPDPLDTVFLVNSGSEADDRALRLAMATTGRQDVVAVAEAYHGWTYATDAISTSIADNPNALSTRPAWVHTVPSPNAYRGEHRGAEATKYAPEAVEIIEQLVAQGTPPAAFICEPFYGNAGGMTLPDGYLTALYAAVRAAGGLAIADEVQVGYGRTGRWFWAFQQQDVVPDIVCVAKAMGNGQPLGAVITTRTIAAMEVKNTLSRTGRTAEDPEDVIWCSPRSLDDPISERRSCPDRSRSGQPNRVGPQMAAMARAPPATATLAPAMKAAQVRAARWRRRPAPSAVSRRCSWAWWGLMAAGSTTTASCA
jgi:4-aminobutyrate aminotransferase-like enzyme